MVSVLPDTIVRSTDAAPVQGVPTDSTRLLVAVESFRGTREPMPLRSPRDLSRYLERSGVGIPAWDAIDVALRQGVPEVWLARLLGPAAVGASVALAGAGGASFTIKAHEPGEWANGATGGLTAEVVNGPAGATERVVIIRRVSTGAEVGRTPAQTTRQGLIDAVARIGAVVRDNVTVPFLDVTAGTDIGLPTVVAPVNFAGGLADVAAVTTTEVRAALDGVSPDLGAMNVVTPGRSTDASNAVLLDYVRASGRTALLEQAASLAAGAIVASAATLRAGTVRGAEGTSRLGGMWPQHLRLPSPISGGTRTVPATVVVAGMIARLERQEGHPNVAPFGDYGEPLGPVELVETYTAADAGALFDAGVNVWTTFLNRPRNRSFRSLELPGTSEWVDLAHTRTDRAIRTIALAVGRQMGSRVINRTTIGQFGSQFRARLSDELWKPGALFGDTADEAFRVDVDTVNDSTSIAARDVNAAVGARMSEHAEFVNVDIAKVPIGQEV